VPQRDVERLGRDVLLGSIRDRPLDPGGNRFDDGRVEEAGVGRYRERVCKVLGLFGSDIETEDLDGNETVAGRLIGPKDGTKRANANLVQDPEGAEGGRWSECRRIVSTQRWYSSRRVPPNVTRTSGAGRGVQEDR
jgi:hypothetical protein